MAAHGNADDDGIEEALMVGDHQQGPRLRHVGCPLTRMLKPSVNISVET